MIGQGESVYALLSQEVFARDTAVSRMVGEMQRALKGDDAAGRSLRVALHAYTEGNLSAALKALGRVLRALPAEAHPLESESPSQLCRLLLEHLIAPKRAEPTLETALLAFAALQGVLEARTGPTSE